MPKMKLKEVIALLQKQVDANPNVNVWVAQLEDYDATILSSAEVTRASLSFGEDRESIVRASYTKRKKK